MIGGYWSDVNNRKAFFIQYAKENGFDPFSADDWHKASLPDIYEV